MKLTISENRIRMIFNVADNGQLSLCRMGTDEREPKDTKCFRPAVELIGNPGCGNWGKKQGLEGDRLRYVTHRDNRIDGGRLVEFDLADDRFLVTAHYRFFDGIDTFRAWTTVKNISDAPQDLLFVSSFYYNGLENGDCEDVKIVHNGWCQEGNISSHTP
ncbi:MAG: hypothetical protein E7632_13530, partial [Ruminococcaceae bacterium]|nr:hypothetical protein [Oscillospiraceae bacterium]